MKPCRSSRNRLLLIALCAACIVMLAVPASAAAGLGSRIRGVLAAHGLTGPSTAVSVYDLTSRRQLYAFHASTPLRPASNEKLVTSATALARWQPNHHFKTELWLGAAGPDAGGVLHGNIYLKGYGDPSLSTAAYMRSRYASGMSNLGDFVAALQSLGVSKITGRVVADDSFFDATRAVQSWRPGMTAYCGRLSALALNEGFGPKGTYVADPSLYAAHTLSSLLRLGGIQVVRPAIRGTTPQTATLGFTEASAHLSRILAAMNRPSDNFFAEELLKGLGADFRAEGTTAAGLKVEVAFLKSIGMPAGSYRLHDGSGLSYADRLSARGITKLLIVMSKRPDHATYRNSLSVAGVNGTLRHRMKHTAAQGNVRAKTGTLAVASNLSGYVTTANQHKLVFSILMNAPGIWVPNAIAAQDAIAVTLARSRP
jgi:serine-type D-Ala-D-Ala carboxypeptidase/endopeptidase (penicillin-binding protein 4)